MPITITPLIELDPAAVHVPTADLVDQVRLDVPAVVTSDDQAVDLLVALGMPRPQAVRRVWYCVNGHLLEGT